MASCILRLVVQAFCIPLFLQTSSVLPPQCNLLQALVCCRAGGSLGTDIIHFVIFVKQ